MNVTAIIIAALVVGAVGIILGLSLIHIFIMILLGVIDLKIPASYIITSVSYTHLDVYKRQIYTYGPIIHNDEVVKDMEKNGVTVINDLDELSYHEKGVMIIRSHGISTVSYTHLDVYKRQELHCARR